MPTFEGFSRKCQLAGIEREVPAIPPYISKEYLQDEIDDINTLIPQDASSDNQLATKADIATSSATFKGTYNSVSDLSLTTAATHSDIAAALGTAVTGADNNDYCYVQVPVDDTTPTRIATTDRYKFNGTAWAYEYSLGDTDLAPYRQFKSGWHTDTTLLEFCQDIVADSEVLVGDLFLGQLSCTGLPAGMSNGEVAVQVNQGLSGKLLLLTITSTNLAPYHWEQSFYNDTLYGWNSFDANGAAATAVAAEALRTNNYAAIVALASDPNAAVTTVTTNPEWKLVYTDAEDRILLGKRQDNTWYFAADLDDILDAIIDGYGT